MANTGQGACGYISVSKMANLETTRRRKLNAPSLLQHATAEHTFILLAIDKLVCSLAELNPEKPLY